jgi:hypothetical protein
MGKQSAVIAATYQVEEDRIDDLAWPMKARSSMK